MQVTWSVAVAGASGYAGGEVLRLLASHPEARIGALTASSSAGQALADHQPHLRHLADRILEPTSAERLAEHDVVVLALPHGASASLSQELADFDGIIVDCGADHRLTDEQAHLQFYGGEMAEPWTYGLPELLHAGEQRPLAQREELRATRRIAAPGCNASAVSIAIQPGVAAELIDPAGIVATLAVGYSGAGRSLRPHLSAAEASGNLQPYGVGGTHRHIPEILQNLRRTGASDPKLSFTPILAPVSRGILAVVNAPLRTGATAQEVRAAWEASYGAEEVTYLLPEGTWPTTGSVLGAHAAAVQVTVDEAAGQVIALCAIDNLVKGTAGAAIQSLNLATGCPELMGLSTVGVAP